MNANNAVQLALAAIGTSFQAATAWFGPVWWVPLDAIGRWIRTCQSIATSYIIKPAEKRTIGLDLSGGVQELKARVVPRRATRISWIVLGQNQDSVLPGVGSIIVRQMSSRRLADAVSNASTWNVHVTNVHVTNVRRFHTALPNRGFRLERRSNRRLHHVVPSY